jgi:hypothetical protein
MTESRNTIGRILDEPILDGGDTVSQLIGISGFLHGKLGEMSDTVWYQLATFCRIQLSLLIEQHIHIKTLQLGDTLLLRHLSIELIHLLLDIDTTITSHCQTN